MRELSSKKGDLNRQHRRVSFYAQPEYKIVSSQKKNTLGLGHLYNPQMKLCVLFAEMSVLERSIAIVIGPTPPGTGVTAAAILQASS